MTQWYFHAELDKEGHLERILWQKMITKSIFCLTQDVFLLLLAIYSRMDIILPLPQPMALCPSGSFQSPSVCTEMHTTLHICLSCDVPWPSYVQQTVDIIYDRCVCLSQILWITKIHPWGQSLGFFGNVYSKGWLSSGKLGLTVCITSCCCYWHNLCRRATIYFCTFLLGKIVSWIWSSLNKTIV